MTARFIVLLEPGMWICETGTTLQRANATEYASKPQADKALAHARIFKKWLLAKVCKVTTTGQRKTAHSGEWNLNPEELERRKTEAREWHFNQFGDRGRTPIERPGINEIKLDRRRNGMNF